LFYGSSLWPDRGIRRKTEITKVASHMFLLRLQVYIPAYSDGKGRRSDPDSIFCHFSPVVSFGMILKNNSTG
jgi:hypothetical protein